MPKGIRLGQHFLQVVQHFLKRHRIKLLPQFKLLISSHIIMVLSHFTDVVVVLIFFFSGALEKN